MAEAVVVVEGSGADLQDVFGALGTVPEFFGSFDALVDLLDERLNHRGRDGQACLSILRIVHSRLIVREESDRSVIYAACSTANPLRGNLSHRPTQAMPRRLHLREPHLLPQQSATPAR